MNQPSPSPRKRPQPAGSTAAEHWLSLPDAAEALAVPERALRQAIERGELAAMTTGPAPRVSTAALIAFRAQHLAPPERPLFRLVEPTGETAFVAETRGHGIAPAAESSPGTSTGGGVDRTSPRVRLPTPLTGFVGRARELDLVTALLTDPTVRLLTLMGVGGVGKTRLAIQAAARVAAQFADGVAFVPLSPIQDPDLVLPAIVTGLGLRVDWGQPTLDQVSAALRHKHLLLVIDNFEHVAAAGPVVAALLSACDRLTALVTSRVRLRVAGEQTFTVEPLPVPALPHQGAAWTALPEADLRQVESVQLFVERARAAQADFALTQDQTPVVAAICHRLDGLPLAIELAAARCTVLSLSGMLARLDPRLPLLTGGPRDLPDRLRTMRDAIKWSYGLLSPEEQVLFRRLASFAGGFTLEAAAAMLPPAAAGNAPTQDAAVSVVESLLGQSLLTLVKPPPASDGPSARTRRARPAEPRFMMLETIREFGQEMLSEHGETDASLAALTTYALAVVAPGAATAGGRTAAARDHLDRLEQERANLRVALTWAIQQGDAPAALRLAVALGPIWLGRGPLGQGRALLEGALGLEAGPPQDRLAAMEALARLLFLQGEFAQSAAVGETMVALARGQDDPRFMAQGLVIIGQARDRLAQSGEDRPEPGEYYHSALALFRQIGDAAREADTLGQLGVHAWNRGDLAAYAARAEEALAIYRRLDDRSGVIDSLDRLSLAARLDGDLNRQADLACQIVALTLEIDDPVIIAGTLWTAAAIAGERGHATLSARLFGAEEALRQAIEFVIDPAYAGSYREIVTKIRHDLGEARCASIWEAGRAVSPTQALVEAQAAMALLAETGNASTGNVTATVTYGLTSRELEVLRLVVAGNSDKEIAAELYVARSTVSKHVSAILVKLGAESRTAATALVYRYGLL